MTIEEVTDYLKQKGHSTRDEPEYVEIRTPICAEQLWFVQLVWMHHDGNIPDANFSHKELSVALEQMYAYLVEREETWSKI